MNSSEIISKIFEESVKSSSTQIDHHDAYLSEAEHWGLAIFLCIFGLIGFLENLLVIFSTILGEGYLDAPSNIFLLSLACADLLVCGLSVPLLVHNLNCSHWIFTIFMTVSKFVVVATAGSIFLLTLNRFISIMWPLKYHRRVTVRRAAFMVAAVWIVAIFVVLSVIISCQSGTTWLAHITRYFLTFYILTTFLMYIYIYALSRQHRKLLSKMSYAVTGQTNGARREFRSLKTLAMVVGSCVACWSPMTISFFFINRFKEPRQFCRVFAYTSPLVVVNAAIDPIIYYYRSRGFRSSIKILVKRFREYFY